MNLNKVLILIAISFFPIFAANSAPVAGFGKSLQFDGSNDYAEMSNYNLPSNSFTIEFWVKPTSLTETYKGFYGLQPGSPNTRAPSMWQYGTKWHLDAYSPDGGTRYDVLIDNVFQKVGEWIHLAWVKDGTTFKYYRNGVLIHTRNAPANVLTHNTLRFGQLDNYYDAFFDDVRVWNNARTEAEIRDYRFKSILNTSSYPHLIHYWPLDEPSGNTIYDVVGNANGTLYNGPVRADAGSSPPLTTDEDTPVSAFLKASDVDGDNLTFQILNTASVPGTVTILDANTGEFKFTPNANYHGSTSFTYRVNDGTVNSSNTATVNITINSINDIPVVTSPAKASAIEDVYFKYQATATDVETSSLSYTFLNKPSWAQSHSDSLYGTPPNGATNTNFKVVVSDGTAKDTLEVVLTVAPTNDIPVVTSLATATATEDEYFVYKLVATDEDGDKVKLYMLNPPSWAKFDADSLFGTPRQADNQAPFDLSFGVADDSSAFIFKVTLTINAVNDTPIISSNDVVNATEDQPFVYTATATDEDQDPLTYTYINYPDWLTPSATENGKISGTPLNGNADTTFQVIASDGSLADTLDVQILVQAVDDPPQITSKDSAKAVEDIAFTYTASALDVDNTPIITFENLPSWLTAQGNVLQGTPLNGTLDTSFTIIASEDNGGTLKDTLVVTLTVEAVNDAPFITSALSAQATEDIEFTYTPTGDDVDNTPTISISNLPSWLSYSASTKLISGTPLEGDTDTTFTITITDGTLSDSKVVTLSVAAVNDPPVIVSPSSTTVKEYEAFHYHAIVSDPDNTPSIVFLHLPSWISQNGNVLSGFPSNETQDTSFTIITNDGEFQDIQEVLIDVIPVNDPPFFTSNSFANAVEDIPFTYNLGFEDIDSLSVLSYQILNLPSWLSATDTVISGTPTNGIQDTMFTAIVSDGEFSDTLEVQIFVLAVDDKPQVVSKPVANAVEDKEFRYLAKAVDVDNKPLIHFEDLPSWLSVSGDTLIGTPLNDYLDTSFTVIATEVGGPLADTLIVTLNVNPVNDPPFVTSKGLLNATEDIAASYEATGFDEEGNLSLRFENLPSWLSNSGNQLSGTPTEGMGDTTFLVIATDGNAEDTTEVQVRVTAVNDAPYILTKKDLVANETIPFTNTFNVSDPDDTPVVSFENLPSWLSSNGNTISGTPPNNTNNTLVDFIIHADDGKIVTSRNIRLYILAVDDPPQITSISTDQATEDIAYEYIAEAIDPDNTPIIRFENLPSWLNVFGDTLRGTPLNGILDTSFTLIAEDGLLADTVIVNLTVIAVNDAPYLTSVTHAAAEEDSLFEYIATAIDVDNTPNITFENLPSWLNVFGDTLRGTPLNGYTDTLVTVKVSDGVLSDEMVLKIVVAAVDDPPEIQSPSYVGATEDILFEYEAIAIDIDNTPLIRFENLPAWLTANGNKVSGTPTEGMTFASFRVIADEDGGSLSDTLDVGINIDPVNDAPIVTSKALITPTEDLTFSYKASAYDIDNSDLSFEFAQLPSWMTAKKDVLTGTPLNNQADTSFLVIASDGLMADTLVVEVKPIPVNDAPIITSAQNVEATEDQVFSYAASFIDIDNKTVSLSYSNLPSWLSVAKKRVVGTPLEGDLDTSFTVIVNDGELADTLDVSIKVNAVNDAPIITSSDSVEANEDLLFTYIPTASDVDNSNLSFTFENLPSWLSVSGDTLKGIPLNFTPDTTFTLRVSDGLLEDTLSVKIKVNAINDAPYFTSADSVIATEDEPFNYTATAEDVDDKTLSFIYSKLPSWLSLANDALVGTPPNNATDTTITIRVTDGKLEDTLVVNISVIAVNDAPYLAEDTLSLPANSRIGVAALSINAVDIDGDSVSVQLLNYTADFGLINDSLMVKQALDASDKQYLLYFELDDGTTAIQDSLLVLIPASIKGIDPQIANLPKGSKIVNSQLWVESTAEVELYKVNGDLLLQTQGKTWIDLSRYDETKLIIKHSNGSYFMLSPNMKGVH